MYLSRNASKRRLQEAQNARNNRLEIHRALHRCEITRRDLYKWGLFTTMGTWALKNGLSPFAQSAYAQVPTGTPPSPLFGALPFTTPMPRLLDAPRFPLTQVNVAGTLEAQWPAGSGEESVNSKRLSWHTDFSNFAANGPAGAANPFANPRTGIGPMEGRPPHEFFAHQRWEQIFPKVGFHLSLGQIAPGLSFHPNMPAQNADNVWSFGPSGGFAAKVASGITGRGVLPPPLIKMRYGEPAIVRIHNDMPVDPFQNNGFARNEASTHNHNAHNGGSSDGAANAHQFPGQFYDYHWGTTLARRDEINTGATDPRASGPDGNGGLVNVPGDFRELQGTLWAHDHRFFFTSENVYKGHLMMLNYYSGKDRGNETLNDGINLRLPSGSLLDWGNVDFDVNLIISDGATNPEGQYFFDPFDTDGFLGDMMFVNFAYRPFFNVLPRKYRFRLLSAGMSRFIQLTFADQRGRAVPIEVIANDGNLLPRPIRVTDLDQQGVAERFDVIVDFSRFRVGETVTLVNRLEFSNGRRWDRAVPLADALAGNSPDPAVGGILQFRVVDQVASVDVPGVIHRAGDRDLSQVPVFLTEQIPVITPVRERVVEWTRGGGDSRDNPGGVCIPECGDLTGEPKEGFPWTVRVNGQAAHSLNANRVSLLVPRPGETEHWTYVNGGGGWDHPIHLHFEEGVTISRLGSPIAATELLARKDVWRLRPGGAVKFQVRFGEFGGAYVNHCHNTVHEDFAMLLRYDILTDPNNPNVSQTHINIIPTPNPTAEGVVYLTPEVLPEGDPANPEFFPPVAEPGNNGGNGRGRGGGRGNNA
ncbi:MAG: multicopper oxidase domain-containing protein [Hyphomicrobiaceae bacterium]|nr:multicopper oxidase domain-containing protein [Hyphomicrobiaceae bacterium]